MSVDEVIEEVIRVCAEFSAETVYLYGSRAKGVNLERSDIDIAVSGIKDFDGMSEKMDEIETLRRC